MSTGFRPDTHCTAYCRMMRWHCAWKLGDYGDVGHPLAATALAGDRQRGVALSGTKTHVKQCFLPLTPLLMVADALLLPALPV